MGLTDLILKIIDISSNLDIHLSAIAAQYGMWVYPIIFGVLALETGDMISAFLPSDTLVFAAGTMAGMGLLNIWLLYIVCVAGVFIGDTANYWLGRLVGYWILKKDFRLINAEHIAKTKQFYNRYGSFTLIIGRYIPFVRTLTPFFGGIGRMPYWKFSIFESIGASTWVALFLFGGYFFGGLSFVQQNLIWIIIILGVVSFVPLMIGIVRHYRKRAEDNRYNRQMERQYKEYREMKNNSGEKIVKKKR